MELQTASGYATAPAEPLIYSQKGETALGSRRRSNIFVKIAVLAVIVFFVVSIVNMQVKLSDLKEQKAVAESRIRAITNNIEEINERLDTPITDDYIRKIARENGYYYSDEIIFYNDLTD